MPSGLSVVPIRTESASDRPPCRGSTHSREDPVVAPEADSLALTTAGLRELRLAVLTETAEPVTAPNAASPIERGSMSGEGGVQCSFII